MYSPSAQSTVLFLIISPRPLRIRLRPDGDESRMIETIQCIQSMTTTRSVHVSRDDTLTSMDGEVFHRDRRCYLSDVRKLLLGQTRRWTAHAFRLAIQSEKT